jgi:hypothetical protein
VSSHLTRYRTLARALDSRFRVPGTPVRFGWDAIIGLIPGAGDAIGGLLGGYGLYVAARLGASPVILARMFLNLGIDLAVGAIPLLGDLFDLAWRGNLRNLALLEQWLEHPRKARRQSTVVFLVLFGALAGLAFLGIWLSLRVLGWLLGGWSSPA